MKKGFLITNITASFFAVVSIGWLIYDFIAYGILRGKMLQLEPLTSLDEKLGLFIWLGVLVFLIFHIVSFLAIASQFQFFKKAGALRVIALLLAIVSCIFILDDIACLSDIGKEYQEGLEVEFEWRSLYRSSALHGLFFLVMLANLIQALYRRTEVKPGEAAVHDVTIFTLVHAVGVLCSGIGLFGAFAALIVQRSHPLLHITFPFLFILSLIPYGLLAGYWLIMKVKEKPENWYDEKQFRDISRAALLTMFTTIPLMALIYILTYNAPKNPMDILWFPVYLYWVIFCFSLGSLYFNWNN
ncbi:hypothetical protein JW835_07010 [bacterium]|nr:hypothetical protein [bacterium]